MPAVDRWLGVQIDKRMVGRFAQVIGQKHVVDAFRSGNRRSGRLIGGQTLVAAFEEANDLLHDGVVHGATGLDLGDSGE